jgi:hypothetical protein
MCTARKCTRTTPTTTSRYTPRATFSPMNISTPPTTSARTAITLGCPTDCPKWSEILPLSRTIRNGRLLVGRRRKR